MLRTSWRCSSLTRARRWLSNVYDQELSRSSVIIFEDLDLIVVNKPSGLLCQPEVNDGKSDVNLLDKLKESRQKVYLVHRLDRPCSGLMVYAKSSIAASELSLQFQNRSVEKEYLCVVNGSGSGKDGVHECLISKSTGSNPVKCFDLTTDKSSITKKELLSAILRVSNIHNFEISKKLKDREEIVTQSLLKIRTETGRKHQIRSQLSFLGLPICGDVKYGAPQRFREKDIALHSWRLSFVHPVTKKQMNFFVDVPSLWIKRYGGEVYMKIQTLMPSAVKRDKEYAELEKESLEFSKRGTFPDKSKQKRSSKHIKPTYKKTGEYKLK